MFLFLAKTDAGIVDCVAYDDDSEVLDADEVSVHLLV